MMQNGAIKGFFSRRETYLLSALVVFILFGYQFAAGQLSSEDIAALQQRAAEEGWTFTVGENSATQYSLDQLCGMKEPDNWREKAVFVDITPDKALPVAFDWRDSGGVTVVKNQGGCGSCWAFATVGPLECNIKIKDDMEVDLSEQWLVSCNSNGWDCSGGWFAHDYHQFATDPCGGTGAVMEADFPYTATNGTCNCPYDHYYTIMSWAYIGDSYSIPSVAAMKQAIIDYGPISVTVHANSAMQAYGGGIFNGCYNGEINHGVTLVGWDDDQGTNGVWIMRNSWGTGWGEDGGYMRMEYGCSRIGYAACFVEYQGSARLNFEYPDGLPDQLIPDEATQLHVIVSGAGGTIPVSGSGRLHYSVDGGPYQVETMTEYYSNRYFVDLPAFACGSRVKYYFSSQELNSMEYFYDPDTADPYVAIAADEKIAVLADDFEIDLGWTVSGSATDGHWDRGVPVGGGDRGDPAADYDGSGSCYLTDNVDDNSDVDGGTTILTSPTMDLTEGIAVVHYARWYSNSYGDAPHSDSMLVYISNNNGANWTLVETVGPSVQADGGWFTNDFFVSDYLTPSGQVKLRFDAADLGSGSVVEAAIDDVQVSVYKCSANQPIIVTDAVPEGTVENTYSTQLEALGGTGALTWTDAYGDLAGTGLSLSTGGLLSGTPSGAGAISFTAMVEDENLQTDDKLFMVTINDHVVISTDLLPDWTAGQAYSQNLIATGGTSPIIWSDKYADLGVAGLSLGSDGLVSGTPLNSGPIDFTATATDNVGDADEKGFSIMINPAVDVTTTEVPDGTQDDEYSAQLENTGGTGAITWTDKNNDLAAIGLTIESDGAVTGVPTDTGSFVFTAAAEDVCGSSDEQQLTLYIGPAYICGDANDDEAVNIIDVTFMIAYLYQGGPAPVPPERADVNSDGSINIVDISATINYLYNGGPDLVCP